MKRIIYDLGSNDGSNIPYYLKKADFVIAVEANPLLVEVTKKNFYQEIKIGLTHY
jgi:predicted RNA methylase